MVRVRTAAGDAAGSTTVGRRHGSRAVRLGALAVPLVIGLVLGPTAGTPASAVDTGVLPLPLVPLPPPAPLPAPMPGPAPTPGPDRDATPPVPTEPPGDAEPPEPVVIAADRALVREAQAHLIDVGLDALGTRIPAVDGWDGVHLRAALCAFRGITLGESSRGPLTDADLELLRTTPRLAAAPEGRGVVIDRTCQLARYHEDGRWVRIMPTSTGRNGQPYRGDYRVQWKRPGWHTSTLYPARSPNMYNAVYFAGPVALHGSNDVPRRPASAGCARLELDDADFLFERLERGDRISVVGTWAG